MAEDCTDGDYLGAYSRFFSKFYARMNPHDLLPVAVSAYSVTEDEIVGEIISVTLQYLNQTVCPPILQAHLVHQVIQEIKATLKKLPEWCGYKPNEKTYASLQLMQAITSKVNEICIRYLDNSRLALLPPPRSTPLPEAAAAGIKNFRRKMEDRYVIVHDLHTTFGIQDDTIANYYAVFDGHAGQDAAVYCASHLHQYLVESVYYPNDPELAFRDAFLTTDARFIEKSQTQKVCGGTTAVCALLMKKKLYVAWAGDSTAMLVKCDSVTQLVDPHRLTRNDEVERVLNSGGVVMPSMGILRVNGVLSVSRAIGDVGYKPYVTGEPEVKCIPLDGTEDFLVLCSDGLSDFLSPEEISRLLYQDICLCQNPLKFTPQLLLKEAKRAGSEDNISVVVVLLTPASEIENRTQNGHPIYQSLVLDLLQDMNEMDSVDSLYSTIMKQTMSTQETQNPPDNDDILAPRNGKHENGDADYDYSDLGPETDVDAIDANDDSQNIQTMHVKNLSYDLYPNNDDDSSHDEEQAEKDDPETLDKNKINVENDLIERDARIDCEKYIDNDIRGDDDTRVNDVDNDVDEIAPVKDDARVDDVKVDASCDVVDDAGPVDYDESPPSPQATKPLQHALIPEADNVADSEDSEDEWNYYRVDPNKEKETATAIDEPRESKPEEVVSHSPDLPIEDNHLEIQSQEVEEDIKCETPKEEVSSELIDTQISAKDKSIEEREDKTFVEDKQELRDMDFQLNPDAAEFVPVSPQMMGTRMNLIEDYPISGSPLKQVPQMDDIQVPSQTEFDEGICRRPKEIETDEKDCTNGDHIRPTDYTDFMVNRQKGVGFPGNLDDSEISSTKAEFGDESVSFLTASEFHRTGVSTVDESFSSSERDYDIAKDPMAMSFTPSDFEAVFDKGVDLNAVHDLSNIDFDDKNGIIEEEVEAKSPELLPELSTLASSGIEQPVHTTAFPEEEPADLVNISSQHEDNESTFIEHVMEEPTVTAVTDYPDTELECQSSKIESSEQQDLFKAEHSPLTDNYSTEFESEKETASADNEQLLSPSIADVDETKPIDVTSEDAPLSITDSQKETCARETDTPSSLSPIPNAVECTSPQMEEDLVASMENVQISSPVPIESPVYTHEPEPKSNQYNFDPFASESVVTNDNSELTLEDNMNASNPITPVEKSSEVVITTLSTTETVQEAVKQNLLDFSVEEEICAKSPIEKMEVESTTPLSPQETCNEFPTDNNDFARFTEHTVDFKDSNNVKTEEEFINTDVCELQTQKRATCGEIYDEPEATKVTPALNLSESMQEFTGLEKQLLPEDVSVKSTVVEFEEKVIATEEAPKDEVHQKEFIAEEIKDTKEVLEEKVLSPIPSENKESVVDKPEEKVVEAVAVAAATAATVAAVTGAVTAQSKAKAKPGAKLTKPPQTKAAPKSTPTSPSKMASATARATATATAKKSTTTTTARPKELDASKKPPISSTTSKVSASKPAPASKTTTTTASKVTARTSTGLLKTKTTTAPQKPSSSVIEKKPTTNGDVKPPSKPAAAKTLTKPATTTATAPKTSLAKPPSSTRTSTTAATKTRPTSAVASATKTTAKATSITSTTAASNAARPKTAPITANATKVRTSTTKSPMIDKQIKETANKQISLARASASSTTKTSRTSTSATSTTTTTVKRTSTAKITSTSTSPMKKSTPTSKLSGKTTSATKTTSSTTGKVKVVQNGVSESIQMTNTIVTTTNSKLGDDVPIKDLSPVVAPTDNQLIMSSD